MTLSPYEVFLAVVPTIALSLWYFYRSSRINRYDTLAIVVSFVYGMAVEALSIKTVHEYDYANLWFMFGSAPDWLPYSVGLGWASMVYVGMRTSDRVGLPWWQRPFLDGAVATVMDLVLDPGASATRWVTADTGPCLYQTTPTFGGIGAWTWCVPDGTTGFWYSVPLGNFIGWFVIVATLSFFYRAGREWFKADSRGWLAQVALLVAGAALSLGACTLLLLKTSIATRSSSVQWAVFGLLIGTPLLLVIAQRARLKFDNPVAWGVVVWPLYIYATWVVMFIAKRIDPASWPLAPIGILATACFGLLLLFLPNLALLRRRGA
jgi:hypothetical protein